MLTYSEETALEAYILKMQEYAYLLNMDQLRLKVAEMVQNRVTPFRDGIPGNGWIKWFKRRHSNLTLRHSEGLEISRAKGLCPENVRSYERRHLLILNGHNSHVTLEIVHKCREVRLDLLILPNYTSHRLQPLDVGVFAPFKRYFKRYRDA